MKVSKQGKVIGEELRKLKTHPRSDELYAIVRQRLPRISLGTVYRNLDRMHRKGEALEIYCGDFVRYDGNVTPHDHFLCRNCRRVWDVEGGGRANASVDIPTTGFHIEGSYTMHTGLCADCHVAAYSQS